MLEQAGVHLLFTPDEQEIYPGELEKTMPPRSIWAGWSRSWRAAIAPAIFEGVVQVVSRLFDIVKPDVAFFGEKDFQQLAVIREMTRQLRLPVTIVGCPTLREPDGLAMSSRNLRLTNGSTAGSGGDLPALFMCATTSPTYRSMSCCSGPKRRSKPRVSSGWNTSVLPMRKRSSRYTRHTSPNTCAAALAAWLGDVRLIDNVGIVLGES